jgi:hypothetical protein
MPFTLDRTNAADQQLADLAADAGLARQLKAVQKALGILQINPRHPGLSAHPMVGQTCPHNSTLFVAYAQNNTPAAYRIFFCYQPVPPAVRNTILIIAITPHP